MWEASCCWGCFRPDRGVPRAMPPPPPCLLDRWWGTSAVRREGGSGLAINDKGKTACTTAEVRKGICTPVLKGHWGRRCRNHIGASLSHNSACAWQGIKNTHSTEQLLLLLLPTCDVFDGSPHGRGCLGGGPDDSQLLVAPAVPAAGADVEGAAAAAVRKGVELDEEKVKDYCCSPRADYYTRISFALLKGVEKELSLRQAWEGEIFCTSSSPLSFPSLKFWS